MRNTRIKIIAFAALVLGSLFNPSHLAAQRAVELLNWTTTSWRYSADGSDQGTAWKDRTFDDSSWSAGLGLFGFESTPAEYPYPFQTVFPNNGAVLNNPGILCYYFRAHFNMLASDFVPFMTLMATNFADDGCVIYLNGTEVGRYRIPAGQGFMTQATGTQAAEGQQEVTNPLSTNSLRVGDNVIAVEVHQSGTASSDIVHGMSLFASIPMSTAVAITSQPQSVTTNVGATITLSAKTSGGPVLYQWQTNNPSLGSAFFNIPGATSSNYVNANLVAPSTTLYRLIASNSINSVISSTAVVTVVADTFGPVMLSATVLEDALGTNRIEIIFNESLFLTSVHAPINTAIRTNDTWRIVMLSSNVVVALSNSVYTAPNPNTTPPTPPKVTLQVSSNNFNWFYRSNYYVICNNVRDASRTNVIAPNSVIAVSWPISTNLFKPSNQSWMYHANWLNDMIDLGVDIYTNSWWLPSYTESPSWGGPVNNVLYHDQENTNESCFIGVPLQDVGTQDQPTLLRTWFMWPTNGATNATLKFDYAADDSAAFYLNGDFLFKDTFFPSGPITSDTRATAGGTEAICKTNIINNVALRRGSNLLAVAVAQFRPPAPGSDNEPFDFVWALQVDAVGFQTSPLPPMKKTNRLTQVTTGNITKITWPTNAYGWALVYTTNFAASDITKVNNTNFYRGPWIQEQPNMKNTLANQFTHTNFPGPRRFWGLIPTQDPTQFPTAP